MKTKDGYEVYEGMILFCTEGEFEVLEVLSDSVIYQEIDDECNRIGVRGRWTKSEVAKMTYIY